MHLCIAGLCPEGTNEIVLAYLDEGISVSPSEAENGFAGSNSEYSFDENIKTVTVLMTPPTDVSFILLRVANIQTVSYEILLQNKIVITPEDVITFILFSM